MSDAIPPPSAQGLYIDANACLLNRQFEKDLERVLQRSRNAKVEAIVVPCMDVERTQVWTASLRCVFLESICVVIANTM